jgi:hypothetical protein
LTHAFTSASLGLRKRSRSRIASGASYGQPDLSSSREDAGRRSNNGIEPPVSGAVRNPLVTLDDASKPSSAFLEFGGYGAERRAKIGADEGEGSDCRDCDQCGDQSIFNGGNPGLIPDQIGQKGAQADSPQVSQAIARKLHRTV